MKKAIEKVNGFIAKVMGLPKEQPQLTTKQLEEEIGWWEHYEKRRWLEGEE
jgi:hypothetical protein